MDKAKAKGRVGTLEGTLRGRGLQPGRWIRGGKWVCGNAGGVTRKVTRAGGEGVEKIRVEKMRGHGILGPLDGKHVKCGPATVPIQVRHLLFGFSKEAWVPKPGLRLVKG